MMPCDSAPPADGSSLRHGEWRATRAVTRLMLPALLLWPLHAISPSPEAAALSFVEGLRDKIAVAEQEQRCALLPDIGERKRETIHEEWKFLSKAMTRQPLVALSSSQRSDFSAVLIRQVPTAATQQNAIYPVAVLAREGGWIAAPLLGSFENTAVIHSAEQLSQQRSLQQWMSRETAAQLQQLLLAQQQQLREQMLQRMQADELRHGEPEQLTQRFLQACAARDTAAVLALLGGLEEQPSDTWHIAARTINQCLPAKETIPWPWSELVSPDCLRVWQHQAGSPSGNNVDTLLGVISADATEEWPHRWKLQWRRSTDGMWSLSLPSLFWQLPTTSERHPPLLKLGEASDNTLYAAIHRQALEHLGIDHLGDARSLADAVLRAVQEMDFISFWAAGASPPESDPDVMPPLHERWKNLYDDGAACLFGEVGFLSNAQHALLVLQRYSTANSDRIELQPMWFERRDQRWFFCHEQPLSAAAELTEWYDRQESDWTKQWANTVFAGATQIGGLAENPMVAADVREVFLQWHRALAERSIRAPLQFCACFNDPISLQKMMRNLAAERLNAKQEPIVLDVAIEGRWAAVCVQRQGEQSSQDFDALYIFISTENGPRLLSQVELKVSQQRRHERLNEQSLKELEKKLPVAAVDELRALLERQLLALREREPQSIPPP